MRTLFVAFSILVAGALACPAAEAAAPALKLTCTSQERPLPKKGKIPGAIDCQLTALRLKGQKGSITATLKAVWRESEGQPVSAESPVKKGQAAFRLRLEPGAAFPACEKFDLLVEVFNEELDSLGKTRLAVVQECPKSTSTVGKATLTCASYAPDGTRLLYPGNGEQARPRLVRELTCSILLEKAPESDAALKATFKVGKRTREAQAVPVGAGLEAAATFFPGDDFPPCEGFAAQGVLELGGQPAWEGSIAIPQTCAR
jgi:hypothetical protein